MSTSKPTFYSLSTVNYDIRLTAMLHDGKDIPERESDEKLLENQPWINDYSLLECKYKNM